MILDEIIRYKEEEIEERLRHVPMAEVVARLSQAPAVRDFTRALQRPGEVALIAEIKRRSPSRGLLREDFVPEDIARAYAAAGAAAISVLADEKFFGGSIDYLALVRQTCDLPLLCKEFIIHPYQIYEARVKGADAVLLIAAVLKDSRLLEFLHLAAELDLACLVEVHDEGELERVMSTGAPIIGINNRDLKTFQTDLQTTFRLMKLLTGTGRIVVSESGVKTRADVINLRNAGVSAVLVGETLMTRDDVTQGVADLLGAEKCG